MELAEITADEIVIPKKFIKSELNSSIWDEGKGFYSIKPEVRKKLLEIAEKFYKSLEIDTPYEDIHLVGSMASYNWTKQSDIDLHLIFDYSKVNKNADLVEKYFDIKKKYWNDNHEIKIYGFDVELSCQEKGVKIHSKAVFSLTDNKWISKPDKDAFSVDKEALKTKVLGIVNQIEKLEKSKNIEKTIDTASKIKDRLKKMRKSGLEKGGEFSIENLAFKYLRNHGYIGKVMKIKRNATDKKLSLEK